jgi:hypothetical protein
MAKLFILIVMVVVVGFYSPVVYGEGWDVVDKGLMGMFVVGQVLNTSQVLYLYDHPEEFYELNPVVDGIHGEFGSSGVVVYKVLSTLVVYLLADSFPRYRRGILLVSNFIVVGVVLHDISVGVGWKF